MIVSLPGATATGSACYAKSGGCLRPVSGMKGPFMKSPVRYLRFVLPLLLLFPASLFAQTDEYVSVKKWETFDFAGQSLKSADAAALEEWELKLVRGIVFGKHGRVFK